MAGMGLHENQCAEQDGVHLGAHGYDIWRHGGQAKLMLHAL